MENFDVEEKIKQKEIEILKKLQDLKKNDELGPLMEKNTCIGNRCFHRIDPMERDDIFCKVDIGQAISYFSRIEDLFIEKLKKETLRELGEFLVLHLDKREISQTLKK